MTTPVAVNKGLLASDASDIARKVEALQAEGVVASDGMTPPFLHYLSPAKQRAFLASLRAGRLREALAMLAESAYRLGVRDAPALLASGRAKIRPGPAGARVEFQPQRVPAEIGVAMSYALAAGERRAELARVLRKGGRVQRWNMLEPVSLPRLSKRDVDDILQSWPVRSRAGRPRQREQ